MGHTIDQFGTGYVLTRVDSAGAGYRWTRRPGPDRPYPLGRPDVATHALVTSVSPQRVRLALPDPDGPHDALTFRIDGAEPIAKMLLTGGGLNDEGIATVLRDTAATLANLHRTALPAALDLAAPYWPRRLANWLRTGTGPRGAGLLRGRTVDVLGARRLRLAGEWCTALTTVDEHVVHGAPGTGAVVPPAAQGATSVLTGDELAAGRPEVDLGYLTGDLVELRENMRHAMIPGLPARDCEAMLVAVRDGYGAGYDSGAVGRAAALRFFVHLHDFSAYVGWHGSTAKSLELLADVLDEARDGTLLPVRRAS